jgi:hypothetical protein
MKTETRLAITKVEKFSSVEDCDAFYKDSYSIPLFFGLLKKNYKSGWWLKDSQGKVIGPFTEQELYDKHHRVVKNGRVFMKPYAVLTLANLLKVTVYFKNCTEMTLWLWIKFENSKKSRDFDEDIW